MESWGAGWKSLAPMDDVISTQLGQQHLFPPDLLLETLDLLLWCLGSVLNLARVPVLASLLALLWLARRTLPGTTFGPRLDSQPEVPLCVEGFLLSHLFAIVLVHWRQWFVLLSPLLDFLDLLH